MRQYDRGRAGIYDAGMVDCSFSGSSYHDCGMRTESVRRRAAGRTGSKRITGRDR